MVSSSEPLPLIVRFVELDIVAVCVFFVVVFQVPV